MKYYAGLNCEPSLTAPEYEEDIPIESIALEVIFDRDLMLELEAVLSDARYGIGSNSDIVASLRGILAKAEKRIERRLREEE